MFGIESKKTLQNRLSKARKRGRSMKVKQVAVDKVFGKSRTKLTR